MFGFSESAHSSLSFLFLADVIFCCCSPFTIRLDGLWAFLFSTVVKSEYISYCILVFGSNIWHLMWFLYFIIFYGIMCFLLCRCDFTQSCATKCHYISFLPIKCLYLKYKPSHILMCINNQFYGHLSLHIRSQRPERHVRCLSQL